MLEIRLVSSRKLLPLTLLCRRVQKVLPVVAEILRRQLAGIFPSRPGQLRQRGRVDRSECGEPRLVRRRGSVAAAGKATIRTGAGSTGE